MTSPVFLTSFWPHSPPFISLFYYLNCNQFVEPQFALYLWNHFHKKKIDLWTAPRVNFSPISLKLIRTYHHIVENWEITMAPLFLRLISWKSPPQSIKILVKLDFFTNALGILCAFVFTESNWEQQLIAPEKSGILIDMWILNDLGRTFSWYHSQK